MIALLCLVAMSRIGRCMLTDLAMLFQVYWTVGHDMPCPEAVDLFPHLVIKRVAASCDEFRRNAGTVAAVGHAEQENL